MSYGLDLSPAQAPLNCFGSGIISRDKLSSRIMARLRPRHHRKLMYHDRLRDGDAHMTEAAELYKGCHHHLAPEKRGLIQQHLDGLRMERERLWKFSDYEGSQRAESDAVSRAETFRTNASRVRAIVAQARKNSQVSVVPPSGRMQGSSVHSSRVVTPASRRAPSVRTPSSGRLTHASLSSVAVRDEEPLEMLQTRAGPVSWTPSPSAHNALQLDLGYRAASPRPPTLGTPGTSGSILSLDMSLAQFSPARMSPASAFANSPTGSLAYSLGSDGFPRPSRRVTDRRGTIQSTTSLPRSSTHTSRRSTQSRSNTQSSHYRQSLENAARRSGSGGPPRRPASQDYYGQRAYTRSPKSVRTSSVPPVHRSHPSTPHY